MTTTTEEIHTEQATLRRMRLPDDAELLAQMWNDSDSQWPGTVSDGVPITAEWVLQREAREKNREVMVWDAGNAIAGYCSLWDWPQEAHVTYIATLNVAPQYQKLGLGRRFLQHYVRRAVEIGSYRLDLHTWPGNLKAVPLYKKCGFFWMPGTSVHMFNFLPTILTMPAAQGFFARHDWYTSLRRELTQAEDDEVWEGMRVFTYRFAAGDEQLTVWADRESCRVTAVETEELFAAAIAGDQRPARGLPAPIRWRVTNRRAAPMHVSLIASGDERLTIDHRATLTVAPGETAELSALVQVAPEMAELPKDRPAPYVRSLLVIDGEVLELGTGMRPQPAVELQTEPEHITLAPGVPQTVEVRVRSRLRRDVAVAIGLAPAQGLATDVTGAAVELPAEGLAAVTVTLRADAGGVYELALTASVSLGDAPVLLPSLVQPVFALPPGGALAARVRDGVRLENETMRVLVGDQGANLRITRPDGGFLSEFAPYPAPPAYPNLFHETRFAMQLERVDGRCRLVATAPSRETPGLVLRKVLELGGGPLLSVALELENRGAAPLSFHYRRWISCDGSDVMHTLPLAAGITTAPFGEFPGAPDDAFTRPEAFAERWAARAYGDVTVGLLWADDLAEFSWGALQATRPYEVPPQARVLTKPFHLYVGPGGWQAVRRLALRHAGATAEDADSRPRIHARLESPAVVLGDAAACTLLVENRVARPLAGQVALQLPDGWQADVAAVAVEGARYDQPQRTPLRITSTAAPGAYLGRAELRSAELDADFDLPLLRLGDGRAVAVAEAERDGQRVLTVDGGRTALDVTPGFGGTVSALREGGRNHLATPFPEVGTVGWMSPWYGGATPIVMATGDLQIPGTVVRERFEAEPVDAPDARGLPWRGVRQRAVLQHEDLRGAVLEIDALTLGGSPVVKLAMRLTNPLPASLAVHEAGWLIFVQPDGDRDQTIWTPDLQLKHNDRGSWQRAGRWLAAQNPRTGRALVLASSHVCYSASFGAGGQHFKLLPQPRVVPAGGTVEIVAFLALARDLDEARRYAPLAELA